MKRGEELVLSKNKFIEKTKEKIKYKNKKLEEEGAGDERRELYKCDKKKKARNMSCKVEITFIEL